MTNSKKRPREDADGSESSSELPHFVLNSRKPEFDDETWWIVNFHSNSNKKSSQGATALVQRCKEKYNWSFGKTKSILEAYRQFLTLKKDFEDWDAKTLFAAKLVDQMWQEHILDLGNYCHDMMMLCGRVVLRNPDGALGIDEKITREKKTRSALMKKFGLRHVDRDVWDFQETDMLEYRFGNEKKNGVTPSQEIVIRVREGFACETYFKVKGNTKMRTVFQVYAHRRDTKERKLRFSLDGRRISEWETPSDLEMMAKDEMINVE
ncbi:MAG: hypothetical protein SGBAC_007127 [Bacillariaceae sp.]